MNEPQRRYAPPGPVAEAFFRSKARRRLILGPFGSGKSVGCDMDILDHSIRQKPNNNGLRRTRWAVVRNTYPDLKNTTVRTWREWVTGEFGQFMEVAPFEHRLRFLHPADDGTSIESDVIFLAMDQEKDKKKLLSMDLTGIVFNEVRELNKAIIDNADGRIGRFPPMLDGGPTWYGMIADSNMPDEDHWLYELAHDTKSGWEVFHQPGGLVKNDRGQWVENPYAENLDNLPEHYYLNQLAGKSEEWISVYLASEYGRIPDDGAYYTDEMKAAERDGRIGSFAYDLSLPVHTFWDLGLDDYMCIWFGQASGGEWKWLHYYENTGKALGHYSQYCQDLQRYHKFTWGTDVWPHDGVNRQDGDGLKPERRCDIWKRLTGRAPVILPRSPPEHGIEAVRMLIPKSRFGIEAMAGVRHLRRYGREHDDVRNVFRQTPRHDEHSHGADAFRTAAMGQKRVSNDVWKGDYSKYSNGISAECIA